MGAIDKIEFSNHSVTAWGGMKLMTGILLKYAIHPPLAEGYQIKYKM